MKAKRYTAEFKRNAVQTYLAANGSVVEVAAQLGVAYKTLYLWIHHHSQGSLVSELYKAKKLQRAIVRMEDQLSQATIEREVLMKKLLSLKGLPMSASKERDNLHKDVSGFEG